MTKHAASTARTVNVVNVRKTQTSTIKAACATRVARDLIVSAEETDCTGCQRQLAADAAQATRLATARKY